jgi:hypothetical protein
MLRHRLHKFSALALVIAAIGALPSCATVETAIVAEPGVTFDLPLGRTATLNGDSVRIAFTQVREDSRCPVDVTCIWAGDAKIELAISRSGSPDDVRVVGLMSPADSASSGDLRIRFVGLAPTPRQADAGKRKPYVAHLILSRG